MEHSSDSANGCCVAAEPARVLDVGDLTEADDPVLLDLHNPSPSRMKISADMSQVMKKARKLGSALGGVALGQLDKFKYLGVRFASVAATDTLIVLLIGRAAAVMQRLVWYVVNRAGLNRETKLRHKPRRMSFTIGLKAWAATKGSRFGLQAVVVKNIRSVFLL